MPSTPERRREPRIFLKTRIVFKPTDSKKEFSTDYSVNLSTTGIFIVTDSGFDAGAVLELHFSLPNSKKIIKVNGRVVWKSTTQSGGKKLAGLGIEFLNLDSDSEQIISDYIERATS